MITTHPAELAFSKLTNQWQSLAVIKLHAHAGEQGFRELVDAGRAERKIEPITRSGIAVGERMFFRLSTT